MTFLAKSFDQPFITIPTPPKTIFCLISTVCTRCNVFKYSAMTLYHRNLCRKVVKYGILYLDCFSRQSLKILKSQNDWVTGQIRGTVYHNYTCTEIWWLVWVFRRELRNSLETFRPCSKRGEIRNRGGNYFWSGLK